MRSEEDEQRREDMGEEKGGRGENEKTNRRGEEETKWRGRKRYRGSRLASALYLSRASHRSDMNGRSHVLVSGGDISATTQ